MKQYSSLRIILFIFGWIFLGLGVIGMALPVLPTAPFILLAAGCFMNSSERVHSWLVEHPKFGYHIEDYFAGRGIRARAKIAAITTLWLSIGMSVWHFIPIAFVKVLVVLIGIGVTVYLLSLPTCPEKNMRADEDSVDCSAAD